MLYAIGVLVGYLSIRCNMRRANRNNINTSVTWNNIYCSQRGTKEIQPIAQIGFLLSWLVRAGDTVLDVGCGPGRYFTYLGYSHVSLHGVEISENAVSSCKQQYPLAAVIQYNINGGLPYVDNSFNIVYMGEVIEHIDDPQKLVTEAKRTLKPNGLLIMNTPFENMIPCPEHVWYFSEQDVRKLVSTFSQVSLFRCSNGGNWEHMLVVCKK